MVVPFCVAAEWRGGAKVAASATLPEYSPTFERGDHPCEGIGVGATGKGRVGRSLHRVGVRSGIPQRSTKVCKESRGNARQRNAKGGGWRVSRESCFTTRIPSLEEALPPRQRSGQDVASHPPPLPPASLR